MLCKVNFIFCLSIVVSTSYKYPINNQRLWLSTPSIEELLENSKSFSDEKSNKTPVNPHGGAIISDSQRNSQDVPEDINKNIPQTTELIERSEKSLQNIWKIIGTDQIYNNKIIAPKPDVTVEVLDQLKIPDHCKQSTYCEDIPDYPQDAINALIKELGDKVNRLPFEKHDTSDTPEINHRVGDPAEYNIQLCNSRIKTIYPLAAAGPDGKWYTLINSKDNPVQGFKGEICNVAGSNCSDIVHSQRKYTVNGVEKTVLRTACEQKHIPRTAAVAVKEGNTFKMVEKEIAIPSCCSCVAKTVTPTNVTS